MKSPWLTSVLPIAAIFSFRMLGLFMLIPIFTLYANDLSAATPALIGFALGAYGLSQGLMQIPFGLLSDKYGRKPIIAIGLLFFLLGSLIGGTTHSIYGMILARILQGMGAIGSVLIALLADLTPEQHRTKAMAIIGSSIGISFAIAMILSPTLAQSYGLSGIFYLMLGLAFTGLILLFIAIPNSGSQNLSKTTNVKLIKEVLQNNELMSLNLGIFCQHFILTATFFILPLLLKEQINQSHLTQQWQFYLYIMLFSFFAMIPFIILAEKKHLVQNVFVIAIAMTAFGQSFLIFTHHYWPAICCFMFFYFVAFNILEATLPSLISKKAPTTSKGTAMGIYSSFQFLGIFAGGSCSGILFPLIQIKGIFALNALVTLIWFFIANRKLLVIQLFLNNFRTMEINNGSRD